MEARRLLEPQLWLLSLLLLVDFPATTRGQGDFDLADALDDPDPTKKPSSDVYPRPKPPARPDSGFPENSGNIYPPPKPQPRPQPGGGHLDGVDDGHRPPRPRPPPGGGGYGGGGGDSDSYGNSHGGGGGGYDSAGTSQGNTVARIVSPIVSVVVVALVGAGASYFRSNHRRNCFRSTDSAEVV